MQVFGHQPPDYFSQCWPLDWDIVDVHQTSWLGRGSEARVYINATDALLSHVIFSRAGFGYQITHQRNETPVDFYRPIYFISIHR